jgi:hypothetical protein
MTPETSLEDTEWLLARAAGYEAGFCLCTSPETVNANGDGEAIMKAIRTWETARMAGAFSEEQKARMQKLENEFSLTQDGPRSWSMVQTYSKKDRLPVSGSVDVSVDNPFMAQWMWLIVQVPTGTTLTDLRLTYGRQVMEFPGAIEGPCALRYRPGMEAKLVDGHWKFVRILALNGKPIECPRGKDTIHVSGKISGDKPAEVKVEIRLLGPAERVTAKNLPL